MSVRDVLSRARVRLRAASDWVLDLKTDTLFLVPVLAASAWFVIAFAWIVSSRLAYPFDLEWLEGALLTSSQRILDGKPLYGPPSADYVSFSYQPLYVAIVAVLGRVFGLQLAIARGVSVAATLVVGALLMRVALRETKNWKVTFVVAGMFFALYPVT